uniref:Uncharacterized protein n=1 Tax=Periophthalmus magnuspinnatus TaxID=409849 RepID=A0A3B4B8P0_9GOBI
MATGTLPSVLSSFCFVFMFIHLHDFKVYGQQYIIPFKEPINCGTEEFYDISSLSCSSCGSNQRRSSTAVTKDGFGCIRCPGSISDEGFCTCPMGSVLERDLKGNVLEEAQCEVCNGSKPASSVPNINGDQSGGLCFSPGSLPTNVNPSVNFAQLKINVHSAWFVRNLYSSAAACLVFSNLTACQALGNMCVLNMHSFSGVSTDACGLFNTIFRSRAALSSIHDISYRVNLPWLYYGEEPGLAIRVLQTNPVPIGFSFRGKNEFTAINLVAAVYDVRGEFLGWEKIGPGNLQLQCTLSLKDLLVSHPEPLFYDVFMDLGGDENKKLLPLPTLVSNQQYNGRFFNQSMKNWYLTRRLFLVDTLSGREKTLTSNPKVIRVIKTLTIFQLVPRTQEGQVFPPLITVTYNDVPISDINIQKVTFSVEYEMDQAESNLKMNTALGVLGGVAVLYSLLKTVGWKRRIASPLIDAGIIFKFLLFYAGDLANVFFAVTVGTALYWLIFYKAQQFVSVLLPLPAQEEQFVTYIGCAFALKQLLHKLTLQLSVDMFLIDWERPGGEVKRDPAPVSIWRTYFVANEWNEIQTIRKICPTFQVMAVLFFLEVVGFSNLALRDPSPLLERPLQAYTPSYSLILRYGVSTALWLCIGIFFTLFYECFVEDKIRQFVDLCSISNISVLLLSHRCFGYYIHGRSVHGHADTNMEEMNNNLKREGESLCGQRGLLPNTDTQTFQISLAIPLRNQYDRIREPLNRRYRPARMLDTSSGNHFEQCTRAYNTMNHFLGAVIDHAHPALDYIVRDKLMLERIIGMEFLDPNDKSIFYNEAHSFSDLLFYGNEATLLIFDTLFFCVVDLGSQSFVLAAVLTYLQQMIFRVIRNALGRKNLANKTLVDERFLI